MTALGHRTIGRWAASAALVLLVGGWPWAWVRAGWSHGVSALTNVALAPLSFGRGGHARLEPGGARVGEVSDDRVDADARLVLSVAGFDGTLPFGVSLRRDAYLPVLVLIAVVAPAPVDRRRRLRALAAGVPAMLLASVLCVCLTAAWLFAGSVRGIYDPGSVLVHALDVAASALLLPPSNRFVVPLALALLLVFARPPQAAAVGASVAG